MGGGSQPSGGANPPDGEGGPGWGVDRVAGVYDETVWGLHRKGMHLSTSRDSEGRAIAPLTPEGEGLRSRGRFLLERVSTISLLNPTPRS